MGAALGRDHGWRRLPPGWVIALSLSTLAIAMLAIALLVYVPPAAVPEHVTDMERHRLAAMASVRATILQCLAGFVVIAGLGFTARSVYLSRETHLTDRLAKAVDQLGDTSEQVRVGGIYHLQRLALNSRLDRVVVADVLSGFLAVRAGRDAPSTTISPDVQTALDVLIMLRA